MKEIKVLEYKKNSKFEIEFTNLNEIEKGDSVVLFLKDGDLSPIFYLDPLKIPEDIKLFIPALKDVKIIDRVVLHLTDAGYDENPLYTFDADSDLENNILPKWNIPKDSAVLFLSESDYNRNFAIIANHYLPIVEKNKTKIYIEKPKMIDEKFISIIIPELHSEDKSCPYHIDNINKVCKELKEKYGVERIELFVSHCFVENYFDALSQNKENLLKLELSFKIQEDNFYKWNIDAEYSNQDIFLDRENNNYDESDQNLHSWLSYRLKEFDRKQVFISLYISEELLSPKQAKEQFIAQLILRQPSNIYYSEYTGGIFSKGEIKVNNHYLKSTLEQYSGKYCIFKIEELGNFSNIFIDKITTTNSTGILAVEKSEKLEVIDCIEFFNNL